MSTFSTADKRYMRMALALAEEVKGSTFPNPAVGAVAVRNDVVVGSGATAPCGGPHAEKRALAQAGESARGATLYVTLEPCSHHGRTPPCTESILASGVRRVVTAMRDPFPRVRGRGIHRLRASGVEVATGLCRAEARKMNEEFIWTVEQKRAWVTLKLAMTLDGRIADTAGGSKWITGARSRAFVHDLRRRHAAIAVGQGTLLADNPRLDVRHVQGRSPARIVFSANNKQCNDTYFWRHAREVRSIIVRNSGARESTTMHPDGIEIWRTGKGPAGRQLRQFLMMACTEGITSILLEGGSKLASHFIENELVNRAYFFYGNRILGGGLAGIALAQPRAISAPIKLRDISVRQFDDDIMISGIPVWS
jgi:diaminohydroxyphosphoribosylaminopyrimidine deaminase/5-amino-6-(5-phosphoribosylamino)uracil reductase